MKICKLLSLIILATLVSFQVQASTDIKEHLTGGWKKIHTKDDILGFERSFPGTEVKEFKAVGFVKAKIEVISQVLRDVPAYPIWMPQCKEANLIKEINKNSIIFFNESKSPWPVKNRGIVIKSETDIDEKTGRTTISFKAIKDDEKYPVKKGLVQITDLSGKYIIEFFGRDLTRITYVSKAHPAGSVPVSMANSSSRLFPVLTIKGLRKMVKLKKYKKLAMKSEERDLIESMISSPEMVEKMSRNSLNEFIFDSETVDMIFEDKSIVEKIIKEKASFESIKNVMITTCKTMLTDDRIKRSNRDKDLSEIMAVNKLFEDEYLAEMFSKDAVLISLVLKDRDVMTKILTNRKLLAKILDSKKLAKTITNDPELVLKMLRDKEFKQSLSEKLPTCNSVYDFRSIITKYVESYKNAG